MNKTKGTNRNSRNFSCSVDNARVNQLKKLSEIDIKLKRNGKTNKPKVE